MSDVFIDYDPSDRSAAYEVAREVQYRGFSDFLIDRDLAPSERSAQRIALEAGQARVIVVLWSAAAAAALKGLGALERAGEFIRYWSEERLVLARLDRTELPLGLRGLPSIPLCVDLWAAIAQAVAELMAAASPSMMDLGDHDWQGLTQVWTTGRAPGAVPARGESAELGDHEWQGATQTASSAPAAQSAPVPDSLFVSYAHNDLSRVNPIVGEISALGFPVWIDRQEMSGVAGWAGQITRAIKSSRAVVLTASALSYASDHVVREMYLAMNAKKKIVPIELEPAPMSDELEYILAPFQRFAIGQAPHATLLTRALKAV